MRPTNSAWPHPAETAWSDEPLKIVIADDLPASAVDLLAAEGWTVDAVAGRPNAAVSITCNRTRLSEVRICLSKDLQFRACEEIDRRACRRDQVTMPPIRGG